MYAYSIKDGCLLNRLGFRAECIQTGSPERASVWTIIPAESATVKLAEYSKFGGLVIAAICIDGRNLVRFHQSNFDSTFAVTTSEKVGGFYGLYSYDPISENYVPNMNPTFVKEIPVTDIRLVKWPMYLRFTLGDRIMRWRANDYCESLNNVGMEKDPGLLDYFDMQTLKEVEAQQA